jgi:hypothetical protein
VPVSAIEELTRYLDECTDDPDLFNELFLEGPPFWSRQKEICRSVVKYGTTVAYSGNMVGKDYLFARLLLWWLYTRPGSLVIVVAPTQNQVGSIVWKEIRRAVRAAPVPFASHVTNAVKSSPQQVNLGDGWQALGFATKSVERASGQHAGELLVLVIEGSGIEEEIWEAIDSLGARRIAINGNPIRATGRFVELIHQAEQDRKDGIDPELAVNAIRIQSTESPHAGMSKSPVGLADRTWLERCYRLYGKLSLWVKSHVYAEIPTVDADTLLPLAWLDWAAAATRNPETLHPQHPAIATRRITCDLGEGVGRDDMAIFVTDDYGILEVVWGNEFDLEMAALQFHQLGQKWQVPHERMSYDRIGIGRKFHLHLSRLGITSAVGYAGAGSPASDEFVNLRSEAAWHLHQRLDPEGSPDWRDPHRRQAPFCIPPGDYWPRLREELSKLTYHLVGTKIALLSKEDHAKVLGHSPDLSDGLCQRFGF